MKIHQLYQEQRLRTSMEESWSFFSRPANLDAITPPDLRFNIVGDPGPMYAGQIIEYRIAIMGIPQTWLTEIKHVDPGRAFIDEQRVGPYKLWYHRHSFEPDGDHVIMRDHVHYALPFGPLGALAHILFVRRMLTRIFNHRRRVIAKKFSLK